jgi:predicted oxidoreductase
MKKAAKIQLENWILDQLKTEALDYYQLLNRADRTIAPSEIAICLQALVTSGQILKLRQTPNPSYALPEK